MDRAAERFGDSFQSRIIDATTRRRLSQGRNSRTLDTPTSEEPPPHPNVAVNEKDSIGSAHAEASTGMPAKGGVSTADRIH
jgi:hypothetical protein